MQKINNQKLSYYQRNKERLIRKETERYKAKRDEIRCKAKERYEANKKYILKKNEEWRKTFEKKNGKTHSQHYYELRSSECTKRNKQWSLDNPGARTKLSNKWRKNNLKKSAEQDKKTYQKNKHKRNASRFKKYYTNINFKLSQLIGGRIRRAIKLGQGVKNIKTIELIGCSIEYLKQHIESLFEEGMSWKNNSHNGWHIDHIIPCSFFDLTDTEQQKKCFHYTNLKPLWASTNISKGSLYKGKRHRYSF